MACGLCRMTLGALPASCRYCRSDAQLPPKACQGHDGGQDAMRLAGEMSQVWSARSEDSCLIKVYIEIAARPCRFMSSVSQSGMLSCWSNVETKAKLVQESIRQAAHDFTLSISCQLM
mmetsp:Transcript_3683/g.6153  ORF Transcript_3683/g.6153 Transcript_3683/m.6153 type:complete len:118 (+) Transcript_3683:121-474(+)